MPLLSTSGTYIGYDPATETWSLRMLAPTTSRPSIKAIHITSSSKSFSQIQAINFTNRTDPRTSSGARLPIYLQYDPTLNKYVDRTVAAGFTKMLGSGVTSGDFDNDGDVDLYVRQSAPGNMPLQSVYWENQGDGTFKEASDLKGATLLLRGPGSSIHSFNGLSTVIADYNLDGFLDIYTPMGEHKMSTGYFYSGLPPRLFRNRANNGNHWVQIDLQGTVSNRDAIGSKVLVTTPDGKVQLRMQDGGNHFCSQDQHRLHFGLGANTEISSIEVRWPTGQVQTINHVSTDQIVRIVENTP